ncbi:MAG: peptide chain release factor-like protein [Candidatus Omnitrophica bacterium]|nr:peptide chain release factor-like protein [Candidatus Omnitrophota bacterium]
MDFGVSKKKEQELVRRMSAAGVDETDIVERFIRSGGPGGQHANKTSTCVYLKHVPTGTEVKCEIERSQVLNRFMARRLLVEKIEQSVQGVLSERRKKIEKIRRQKRKRSRRAKEKMLRDKKLRSDKKRTRRRVEGE